MSVVSRAIELLGGAAEDAKRSVGLADFAEKSAEAAGTEFAAVVGDSSRHDAARQARAGDGQLPEVLRRAAVTARNAADSGVEYQGVWRGERG